MRILAIAAHPDDLDFGCAGSVGRWTAEGHEVVYCLVTSGEAGGEDATMSREDMARLRQQEQTAAAKVVGVTELHFLGFPDGSVEANLALRKAIARVIRIVRPDRVVTQSPERNYDRVYGSHPDHLATGEATFNAVYPDSRNRFAFPDLLEDEGLEPHTVEELWLMGGPEPNRFVDITDTLDAKIEALLCHESQIPDPARITELLGQWGRDQAMQAGMDTDRRAEQFRVIQTV